MAPPVTSTNCCLFSAAGVSTMMRLTSFGIRIAKERVTLAGILNGETP